MMPSEPTQPVVSLRSVRRSYGDGPHAVHALSGIDLDVRAGDTLAIVGSSGSGKSTLLNILGLLDAPTEGRHVFCGQEVSSLSDNERADLRNRALGFVFQQCHLVPHLDCVENACMPLLYGGLGHREAREAARIALEKVGLAERMTHRPHELSGGQRQRVALARALVGRPRVLLADEPTGALDSATGALVLDLMLRLAADAGATLILVTHDNQIARAMRRRIVMKDGVVVKSIESASDDPIAA